jgi:hypothetical protein
MANLGLVWLTPAPIAREEPLPATSRTAAWPLVRKAQDRSERQGSRPFRRLCLDEPVLYSWLFPA